MKHLDGARNASRRTKKATLSVRTLCILARCVVIGSSASVLIQADIAGAVPSVWSVTPTPATKSELVSVSCTSTTSCMAVGRVGKRTLAESWDGEAWSVVATPNPGYPDYPASVSCSGPKKCMAVGTYFGPSNTFGLAMRWLNDRWAAIATRNPGMDTYLNSVSCTGAKSCFAVGRYVNSSNTDRTLAEFWNGTSWSVITTPNAGSGDEVFQGVSCASADYCVAVGSVSPSGVPGTLTEAWDGSTWSIVPSPDEPGYSLQAVSCTSSVSCVAIGDDVIDSNMSQTLVETWDGSSWTVTPSPNPDDSDVFPSGVSCTSSTNCVLVGEYFNHGSRIDGQTLIESLTDGSWSITPSPDPGTKTNALSGVSCSSDDQCVAAGVESAGQQQALVETGTP